MIPGEIEAARADAEAFVGRVESERRATRRPLCRVCHTHPVYAHGQPTCGERPCRLAWAPGWAPTRKEGNV